MKKTIITFTAFVIATLASFAQEKVTARYLEETELVSIAAHLAGTSGYTWNDEDETLVDYVKEVDSTFAPYKSHPVVTFAKKKLHGWHFPMHIALRLHIVNGEITYDENIVRDFDDYYDSISKDDEEEFISLLQDFYKKTKFHEFYLSHQSLYKKCEKAMQEVVDMIDFGWYERFFGPRDKSSFHIYLGILNGPGNYAIHQRYKDGSDVVNALMGCCERNDEGKIFYGVSYTLPIIIHECNHSYCNPLDDEIWGLIEKKMTEIFNLNAKFYAEQAYGAPIFVTNETFVEACVVRYLMSHKIDLGKYTVEDWIKMDEEERKYFTIRDIIKVLDEREAHPDLYPTMHDFMPRIVETINSYQVNKN